MIGAFKKPVVFLKSIKSSDKVAILHDADPDGICSSVLISTVLERLRSRPVDLHFTQRNSEHIISKETIQLLKKEKVTHFITADLNTDGGKEQLDEVAKFAKILVFDHHELLHKQWNDRIIILKPQLFSKVPPVRYCTSKLAYDFGSELVDLDDKDWLAVVGSIADFAFQPWLSWINAVFKKYGKKMNDDIYESYFGRVAEFINAIICVDETKINELFEVLQASRSPETVFKSKLSSLHKKYAKEIDRLIEGFAKSEYFPDVNAHFYKMSSKYNVKGTISTIISKNIPDKTIIVYEEENGIIGFSARRSDAALPMNLILRNAVKGLRHGHAGGHIPAAGGHVDARDFRKFKANLLMQLASRS